MGANHALLHKFSAAYASLSRRITSDDKDSRHIAKSLTRMESNLRDTREFESTCGHKIQRSLSGKEIF